MSEIAMCVSSLQPPQCFELVCCCVFEEQSTSQWTDSRTKTSQCVLKWFGGPCNMYRTNSYYRLKCCTDLVDGRYYIFETSWKENGKVPRNFGFNPARFVTQKIPFFVTVILSRNDETKPSAVAVWRHALRALSKVRNTTQTTNIISTRQVFN